MSDPHTTPRIEAQWIDILGEWGEGPLLTGELDPHIVREQPVRCTGVELWNEDEEEIQVVRGCEQTLIRDRVYAVQIHVDGSRSTTCIPCAVKCGGLDGTAELIEARLWLSNPRGVRAVDAALSHNGLPAGLHDDLVHVVLEAIADYLSAGKAIETINGFTRTCVKNAAGRVRQRVGLKNGAGTVEFQPLDSPEGRNLTPNLNRPDNDDLGPWLRRVGERKAPEAWMASALLTYISITTGYAEVGDTCPQPKAGATPFDAALWAGLWYAGRTECFVDPTRTHLAIDRDRARKCEKLRQLLNDIVRPRRRR
jgi:hypothetical protein